MYNEIAANPTEMCAWRQQMDRLPKESEESRRQGKKKAAGSLRAEHEESPTETMEHFEKSKHDNLPNIGIRASCKHFGGTVPGLGWRCATKRDPIYTPRRGA